MLLAMVDWKFLDQDYFRKGLSNGWDRRKLGRILTERAKSQSIAASMSFFSFFLVGFFEQGKCRL